MSQTKNQKRWKLPNDIELRRGQQEALECIERNPKQSEFVFVLPTGYGKSFVTLLAYQMARQQGRCNRLLIVVATGIQRQQYARDLAKDAKTLNIDLLGGHFCARECNGESFVIKSSLKNHCEVFITTVQSLNPRGMGFYHDLMSKGDWMLVADEAHHYSDENTWGKSINQLPARLRIGLTATPSRTDNKDLVVGGGKEYDVEVTTKQAVKEGSLRPFRLELGDYEVDLNIRGEVQTKTLSQLQEDWNSLDFKSVNEWEIKRQCRYSEKYIQGIFVNAYNAYSQLEMLYPCQNQILVFAWSCEHAKSVAKQINSLTGNTNFADWIGTSGRTPEENDEILKRFLAEEDFLPCLVQVNKASEGFNNPRCSIAIFLNAISADTPMLLQQLGRVMRVNKKGSPNAVVFVGRDHPLAYADLTDLGQISKGEKGADDFIDEYVVNPQSEKRYDIKIPPLSEIFVTVKRLIGFDAVNPFAEGAASIAEKLIESGKYSPHDKEALLQNILALEKEVSAKQAIRSESTYAQERDIIRRQVATAVNILVNRAVEQTLKPQKVPGSIRGDWYKKTNSYLSSKFGKTESLDIEDLKAKLEFVSQIAEEINESQEVPKWMIP